MYRTSQSSIRRRMRALSERESASRTGPSPSPRLPRSPSRSAAPQSASPFPTQSRRMSHQQTPAFPATRDSNLRKVRKLTPLFSISSALFCVFAQLTFPPNPFVFYRLRTLLDNYRGWGYLPFWQLPSPLATRRFLFLVSLPPCILASAPSPLATSPHLCYNHPLTKRCRPRPSGSARKFSHE